MLLILAVIFLLFALFPFTTTLTQQVGFGGAVYEERAFAESKAGLPSAIYDRGFAPEVSDRKITKTATLFTEVERGSFQDAEEQLKTIAKTAEAFILNENVQKYGTERRAYYAGWYTLKVEESKYAAVVEQLKQIGEVQTFNENAEDITEQFTDAQIELDAEKERLRRYQQLFAEAATTTEKLEISDRIFNQERTIKYLEDQLKNVGTRVQYATVYVTLTEKQSAYVDAVFVQFSELITGFVNSLNSLLKLLFAIVPYAVVVVLVWVGVRKLKKRKK